MRYVPDFQENLLIILMKTGPTFEIKIVPSNFLEKMENIQLATKIFQIFKTFICHYILEFPLRKNISEKGKIFQFLFRFFRVSSKGT